MTREEAEALLVKHRDASPMKQKYYCHLIDLMTTIPLHAKCETASVIAGLLEENERLREENGQVKKLLRRLFNKATCLRHGQLTWAVEKGEELDERICEVEAYEEKHGRLE